MPTMAPPEINSVTANVLLGMNDDQFKAVVEAEMRVGPDDRNSAEQIVATLLRTDRAVLGRWLHTLRSMHRSVENQLAAKEADWRATEARLKRQKGKRDEFFREREKYERWRAGSIRFKTGLEQRLMEARRLADTGSRFMLESALASENLDLVRRVRELETAIRSHYQAFPEEDDPSDADTELWSHVIEPDDLPAEG